MSTADQTVVSPRETAAVVIPTLNVAHQIRATLEALRWVDQVIVVDMGSNDETEAICASFPNVRFFTNKAYIYENVNFGFEQATTDWVIRLDSDEVMDGALQESIQKVLASPDPGINGYYFRARHFMFGKPMEWGTYLPEFCLRKHMFRRGSARYECRREHEDVTTTGELKVLPGSGRYDHFTNPTVEETIRKMNYYTERDAERWSEDELHPPRCWYLWWRAIRMFVLYYFQYKGYRDGFHGLFCALFRGPVYIWLEESKRWERWARLKEKKTT